MNLIFSFMLLFIYANKAKGSSETCIEVNSLNELNITALSKSVIPEISRDKTKGAAGGMIVVIGGSEIHHSGSPYFSAISALRVGADLVHIVAPKKVAPVLRTYSPDITVVPFGNIYLLSKIYVVISNVHIVVLGPALGRDPEDIQLAYEVIKICKTLKKPLVIDADGLYAIALNVSILKDYPSPGAILTPNYAEVKRLKNAIRTDNWFDYWGPYVSVLEKGKHDEYHSSLGNFTWKFSDIGSGRRGAGQGDILAGALGTFFNWALESNLCKNDNSVKVAQMIATYSAAKLTRTCNSKAFGKLGRSMATSDMVNEIHSSFKEIFDE